MRGGKRVGAGRPKLLSAEQRFAVGVECESRWEAIRAEKERAAIEASFSDSDYRSLIEEARAIPQEERRTWLASARAADRSQEVDWSIDRMTSVAIGRSRRLREVRYAMPYGVRNAIIADVVSWTAHRFNVAVSRDTVDRCWKIVRKFIADSRAV